MTIGRVCDLAPFLSPVVAQVRSLEDAGSALQILTQTLENYMATFKAAICNDILEIVAECCGSEPTAISFLELTDTPNTYAGSADFAVAVKNDETGLTFVPFPTPPAIDPIAIVGTVMIWWLPNDAANQVTIMGSATMSTTGANTGGVVANTSFKLSRYRTSRITATANNSAADSFWGNTAVSGSAVRISSSATRFGFRLLGEVATNTNIATQKQVFGLSPQATAYGNITPTALTDTFNLAYDASLGHTNWQILRNDNAGTGTYTDLGSNFPINTTATYQFEVIVEPGVASVFYRVTNLETGDVTSGTFTTEIPTTDTALVFHSWIGNGATAGGVGAVVSLYKLIITRF